MEAFSTSISRLTICTLCWQQNRVNYPGEIDPDLDYDPEIDTWNFPAKYDTGVDEDEVLEDYYWPLYAEPDFEELYCKNIYREYPTA